MSNTSPAASDHRPPTIDAALRSLLPFEIALVLACGALQITIAATGGTITLLAGGITLVIAVAAVIYLLTFGRPLGQLRFGMLVAHALLYVTVNASFTVHALIRGLFGDGIDNSWIGAVITMPGLWALGFLVHAAGSLLSRGFEAGRA